MSSESLLQARGPLAPARRGGNALLRAHCLPRWSGGDAPSSKVLTAASAGKKTWCTKPGADGSSPGWIDFTKPAPSGPPDWMEDWDYTQVTAHEILLWCIDDTVDLLKKTPPPPPLGVHDADALVAEYVRLSKCAETESVEIYAGTQTFLKLQAKTWQCYGEIVRGYKGGKEASDLTMTVREATVDHVIRQRLLSRFGMKMDNMPDNPMEHDLGAAMMFSADATRDVVGRYRRKLQRIDDRRRERDEERKDMQEVEAKEDGDIGREGV